MINPNSIPHSITAAIGAVFISTLFVVAAVGPVSPAAASPAAIAQVSASAQANA
jgi:hypothetical protein